MYPQDEPRAIVPWADQTDDVDTQVLATRENNTSGNQGGFSSAGEWVQSVDVGESTDDGWRKPTARTEVRTNAAARAASEAEQYQKHQE